VVKTHSLVREGRSGGFIREYHIKKKRRPNLRVRKFCIGIQEKKDLRIITETDIFECPRKQY